MARILPKSKIPKLVELLSKKRLVYAPQKIEGELLFAPVDPSETDGVILDYQTTVLPPKALFFPPEENLFVARKEKIAETNPPAEFVVFGLNAKDLAAICYLDEIMSKEPADSFYLKRREKAALVAVAGTKMGTAPGGDLILEKAGDSYQATALTKAGEKITRLSVFEEGGPTGSDPSGSNPTETELEELLADSELLAQAVAWSRTSCPEIWERLGKQCLGCGICTYVCPLCYCFTAEDRVDLDGTTCTRCRRWDACTLPDFATVAGGFNFRKTIKERYYNWYHHKFVRAYKEFGRSQCVACGRCQKYCPAGIDIEKVLVEIVDAFQKVHPERRF